MKREDFLGSAEWVQLEMQHKLWESVKTYMEKNDLDREQMRLHLGLSKRAMTSIMVAEYDGKLSQYLDILNKINLAMDFEFITIPEYINKWDAENE